MSLLVTQLADWLETQGVGQTGVDIFEFQRPPTPVEVISLHPTGGYPPPAYTKREFPTMQIFARAATPDDALRKAYDLFRRLHRQSNLDLGGGVHALVILAINSPVDVGTEQVGGTTAHLASFNIQVQLRTPSS